MNNSQLAETIRELRKALNLGRMAFAERIGSSWTSVAHYESGGKRPDPFTLARIVAVAVKAQQWGIAQALAQLLPGVKEGLLKPAWGDMSLVGVEE